MSLKSAPTITAEMYESPLYQVMGGGLTDRIFLLGHADGLALNDPVQVSSMNEVIQKMNSDVNSPLIKGLLEAFYAGARDIWVMAVAPMSEYEEDLELRDEAYYQTYSDRLSESYEILKYWDIANITVPIDAPFNSTVDFLGPLASYCAEAFELSGDIHLALIGTRGEITSQLADAMVQDGRLDALGNVGKFISIFAGEASFNFPLLETVHRSSAVATIAGQMSTLPFDRGVTFLPLKNIVRPVGPDLDKERINTLAESGINYVGRNIKGRRGVSFQTVAFTDNTLSADGSDYWSMVQMRLASAVSAEVRSIGKRSMGNVGFSIFKTDVQDYMLRLHQSNVIRDYTLDIYRRPDNPYHVYVDISLTPYFGLRDIHVNVFVGPAIGG